MVGDDRDERPWVVFELTYAGEGLAAEGLLEEHLRNYFSKDTQIFVPYLTYTYGGQTSVFNAMEGYCFVESGVEEDTLYIRAASESPFLKKVFSSGGYRSYPALLTVPDSNVQELQKRLDDMIAVEIEDGMEVEVRKGISQGLAGTVLSLSEDTAHVLITLRTLRTIRAFPRFALLPKDKLP